MRGTDFFKAKVESGETLTTDIAFKAIHIERLDGVILGLTIAKNYVTDENVVRQIEEDEQLYRLQIKQLTQ